MTFNQRLIFTSQPIISILLNLINANARWREKGSKRFTRK